MTIFEALELAQNQLAKVSDSPQAEAYRLLERLTNLSRTDLTLKPSASFDKRANRNFK